MLIISNPVSGHKKGPWLIETFALPLLNKHSIKFVVKTTNAPGHAGELAKAYATSLGDTKKVIILISGGDGTIHEVINALYAELASPEHEAIAKPELQLILLNSGTANALFHSVYPLVAGPDVQGFIRQTIPAADMDTINQLQSLVAYLRGTNNMRSLTLARSATFNSDGSVDHCLLSLVVASTALHANLLHTSEELRESMPGVERFTEAAKRNLDKWSHAKAILRPVSETSPVLIYEPSVGLFVECSPGPVTLDGPFAYFLSTVNVDRLESGFIITPLATRIKPQHGTMEVVVIRPLRGPYIGEDSAYSRQQFVETLMGSMGAARSATHLNIRYHEDSQQAPSEQGHGPTLVEYYRCAGWEWIPDFGQEDAGYMCVDGAILTIKEGGRSSSWCVVGGVCIELAC